LNRVRTGILHRVLTPQVNILTCASRMMSSNTIYTEQTVAGTERTPNTNLSILPVYHNGQKYDTRLVGVEVIPNSKEILEALYAKGTAMCEAYGTETYFNRWQIDQFRFRWDICLRHNEVHKIEDEIAVGQMEELIAMAKGDIELIYHYNEVIIPSVLGEETEISPVESTEEEEEEDLWRGEGPKITIENFDEEYAKIEAMDEDLDEEANISEVIERYEEMAEMKKEREAKMIEEAEEMHAVVREVGGGWRMGS